MYVGERLVKQEVLLLPSVHDVFVKYTKAIIATTNIETIRSTTAFVLKEPAISTKQPTETLQGK